jgi:hypothetical protein
VTEHRLPRPKSAKDMLGDLLGRRVTVRPCAPFAPGVDGPATIAVYVEDSLRIAAMVSLDLTMSAYVAAAIELAPPKDAEAAIDDGALSESMRENLCEVLNIAASLFNVGEAPHIRLYDVHHAGDDIPHAVEAQALALGRREDLRVDVAGYGTGRLTMMLV